MKRVKELAGNKAQLTSELLTVAFMALIVGSADWLHVPYILFPELAALASDVLLQPSGKWAKEPWKLVATPVITATFGAAIALYLPYGVFPILLDVVLSLAAIRLLKSSVSPAISAGALPIVLGIRSWLYPLCILCTLTALALLLIGWKATPLAAQLPSGKKPDDKAVEQFESPPKTEWWLPSLLLFVLVIGGVAQGTGWRFILFPPIIVMAYEMFGHTDTCPWAKPPYTFPLICALAGLAGVEAARWLGVNPLSASLVLIVTFVMIKLGRLRLPPALAIGLIPFIMPHPRIEYAISVGIGTVALTLWFLADIRVRRTIAAR